MFTFRQGLEVIEAHYLFGADYDNIDIVIHPQSIIHSMIETQVSAILQRQYNNYFSTIQFYHVETAHEEQLY